MLAQFCDLQDPSSPLNGSVLRNKDELIELLHQLRQRDPFVFELVIENRFRLTVGIHPDLGCVQLSPSDGGTPYLMALSSTDDNAQESVEFLMGDTPTPIEGRYCLPFDLLTEVIAAFIEHGRQSDAVTWEEI